LTLRLNATGSKWKTTAVDTLAFPAAPAPTSTATPKSTGAPPAGSVKVARSSLWLPAPGAQSPSQTLSPAASCTPAMEASCGLARSVASSGMGVKVRRCSAECQRVSSGSVCVDAGGTMAQP